MLKRNCAYSQGEIEYSDGGLRLTCKTAGTTSTEDLVIPPNVIEVTDGTVVWSLIDISVGGGEAVTNYSLEEQRIGTWIDGKPLYQITIQDTMPTSAQTTKLIDISYLYVETPIAIDGFCFNRFSFALPINAPLATVNHQTTRANSVYFNKDNADTYFKQLVLIYTDIESYNGPVYITIQYTKATD